MACPSCRLRRVKGRRGFIAHAGWQDEAGAHIREIWKSQEDRDNWAREIVAPITQQRGLQPPPIQIDEIDELVLG